MVFCFKFKSRNWSHFKCKQIQSLSRNITYSGIFIFLIILKLLIWVKWRVFLIQPLIKLGKGLYKKLEDLNSALNILNNEPIGKSEILLMKVTLPNIQIHKIDFRSETTKKLALSKLLLRPPDWIYALYRNMCLLKDWYVRFQLVLESNASWTLWINQDATVYC